MIDKLRKKIFWIIQIPITIIVLGVIVTFTSLNYKNTIASSIMFIDRLEERKDRKEEKPKEFNELKLDADQYSINIEGIYKFEIRDNKIIKESNDTTDEIRKYAIESSDKKIEEGFIGNYIYKIRKVGNGSKEITLMENADTIKDLKITIISSVAIGILAIIIIYIIAKKISKIIVRPIEESFEKQKQFVSDASHELKTPLAVIEANTDVLKDKVGENKWITYIQNEVHSMNKLVNDLLVLAKMENTNNINNQKFDISKEIEMSTAVFESMIYERKIKLETNIAEGIEFYGEAEDIKHIVSILLDNAIKHTPENKKIIVNFEKEKNNIKLEVKNEGEPIPKEEQERIFERFYRIDKARNRNEKRYGLGLSIAKEIVDKYKGIIKADSKNGFTSFIVKLNNK